RDGAFYYKTLRDSIAGFFKGLAVAGVGPGDPQTLWALRDLSFEVRAGEVLGIMGRNGAGKTTLLKILSRITRPTTGEATIRGRVGSLLEVGTGFHPELTGRENIFLNGSILGMGRREINDRLDEIVAFAELDRFLETPVKRYSSGMYVRLAFAVAAHMETEILLVDEVLAVGDYEFQKKCIAKMDDVGKHGRTVLLVSHSMASVRNLCSRALLLDAGRLAMDGPAEEVVRHYFTHRTRENGEVLWADPQQAPGDEDVRLLGVRILDSTGRKTADLDIQEPFRIQFCYSTRRDGLKASPGFQVRDQVGTAVFMSFNWPSYNKQVDPWFDRPAPEGVFVSECQVPGNFLNAGVYSVTAFVDVNLRNRVEEEVLSFRVVDTINREELECYGVVRPLLDWHTEYLGQGQSAGFPDTTRPKSRRPKP
ncbi:MAG: ABC transporter ATP-binding protein, partial [Planctomycetaceae bacterium]